MISQHYIIFHGYINSSLLITSYYIFSSLYLNKITHNFYQTNNFYLKIKFCKLNINKYIFTIIYTYIITFPT